MSGKSYICANSVFTWFLKVHQIKFSERQTSLGSFCLILECWQIYSRQTCWTRVTSSGILLCNISELQTPTVPPVKPSECLSQKQSCSKWSFRPVGGGGFRPTAEDRYLAKGAPQWKNVDQVWTIERDRMAQGEPTQLYWAGFFLFGPFPEENMFGFSWFDHQKPCR